MKVTNRLGLPESLVKAVSREEHNPPGSYSVTTLLKGAREILLTKRHWGEIETDAADSVWAVFGTAAHTALEKKDSPAFKEERFSRRVSDSEVTGRVDSYDLETGEITDYKTASVWKAVYNDFSDWKRQGLAYAWLVSAQGLPVGKVRFVALLKDHSKRDAKYRQGYPKSPVCVYEFYAGAAELAETEARITEKVRFLEELEGIPDEKLPLCSEEERWAAGETWAVKKKGRQRAVRVFEAEAAAEALCASLGSGHSVEKREAESRKCESYCLCREFCAFWRETYGGEG